DLILAVGEIEECVEAVRRNRRHVHRRVRLSHCLHHGPLRGAAGDPLGHDSGQRGLRDVRSGREHELCGLGALVAEQITQLGQDHDAIDLAGPPSALQLDAQLRATTAHTQIAGAWRNDHGVLGAPLAQALVEANDDRAAQVRHDAERLRYGLDHLRRPLIALAARWCAVLRAAQQRDRRDERGAQGHVSAFSLSASRSSCSRSEEAFSRSRATTSAGARATNVSLASLPSVARSCPSRRSTSAESRARSRSMSMMSASGMNSSVPPRSTAWAPPAPEPLPRSIDSTRAIRRSARSSATSASSSGASTLPSRTCSGVDGGTLYSVRSARTVPISSISACIRASASASSLDSSTFGHAATISDSARDSPPADGSFRHSASVTKGMIGCSSRSTVSSATTSVACAAARLASGASACMRGLISSRYQSASSFQKNARAASAASSKRNCSS